MIRVLLPVPDPAPLTLRVEGDRHHYLVHVLRVRSGQTVEVFDGRNRAFTARIDEVTDDALILALGTERTESPARRIWVVQGLPKGDKLEWIIEKATELGVSGIAPVSTERSIVKLDADRSEKKRERWQRIAEEAARQCRRSDVPQIWKPGPLLDVAAQVEPEALLLILDEAETAVRLAQALPEQPDRPVALVVGPEGGLSRAEVEQLVREGGVAVSLGRNILRTETAALAAVTILRHRDGLLG